MHHYVVEALLTAGLREEAWRYLHSYWGAMIRKGADTFWEVYVASDDLVSPYNSHLMNSYCHAWVRMEVATHRELIRRIVGMGAPTGPLKESNHALV